MSITLAAIARACGVSTSTVSLALRDHPRIPAVTRHRIKDAAKSLGYEPNRSVSRVMSEIRAGGKSSVYKESLAYLTADTASGSHSYESKLFKGVASRAAEMGYGMDRFELGVNGLDMARLGRVLASRGIRGIILAPWPNAHSKLNLECERLATVAIGYTLEKPDFHRVARDTMHALRGVFAQLTARGYKRIGFVMERSHEERMDLLTLAAFQLNVFLSPESRRIPPLMENDLRQETFGKWLQAHKPDLIFTMYRPVLGWLREMNHKVPEEKGVFAFNCESPHSELSGIYPAYENIGAAAVEQVAALVERGDFGIPTRPTTTLVPGIACAGSTIRL